MSYSDWVLVELNLFQFEEEIQESVWNDRGWQVMIPQYRIMDILHELKSKPACEYTQHETD